jgi:tRNA(fMet)-specific endonuclease VapC
MRYLLDTNVCVMYLIGTPIAAIVLANSLTMTTCNAREFDRVEGLQIEDWEVEA